MVHESRSGKMIRFTTTKMKALMELHFSFSVFGLESPHDIVNNNEINL
ncbi:MAG TPA: hypothetical protein VI278_15215 [Nitrososphaeraceae archaeon]|jgi:hypothetical protein